MADDVSGKLPPPYVLAIVICEGIWLDPTSGKRFLLGCFSAIGARQFPATQPVLGLYVALTNGRGKIPFRALLVDADEEHEPLWEADGEIEVEDPRAVAELDFIMSNVTFPAAGEYRMQVFACGEFLIERRLMVVQV